jgi:hypothetical protein
MLRSPSSSRPRRRVPALVAGLTLLVVVAAGCHQDNTPQFYNSLTKDNFVQGCVGGSTGTTLASSSLCGCMYQVVTSMVPASSADEKANPKKYSGYSGPNFQQLNSLVKSNPQKVPTQLQDAWAQQCSNEGYTGTTATTSSGGPTTTA